MTLTIQGDKIESLEDLYDEIEKSLTVGQCPWGRNLDSLDEIVSSAFNYTDNPNLNVTELVWINSIKSKARLGATETQKWLTEKRDTAQDENHRDHLDKLIEGLSTGETQTLFDILVEIFESNQDIKLRLE